MRKKRDEDQEDVKNSDLPAMLAAKRKNTAGDPGKDGEKKAQTPIVDRLARDLNIETDEDADADEDEPQLIGDAAAEGPALKTASVEELKERLKALQQTKAA